MRGRDGTEAIRGEAEASPRQVRGETEAMRSRGRGDAETRLGRSVTVGGDTKLQAEESRGEAKAMPCGPHGWMAQQPAWLAWMSCLVQLAAPAG